MELLQKRPVHLLDSRKKRDLCLLVGQMCFKNGVLYENPSDGSNHFRKILFFVRAQSIYDTHDLTGYSIFSSRLTKLFEYL